MSELSRLIKRFQRAINRNASYINTIRHPRLLVASLQELNDLKGNDSIKDSVAKQVSHLVMMKMRASRNPTIKEDEVMLNTVLTGPPGVGKTLVGTKLAKIWYSLGYLDGSRNRRRSRGTSAAIRDMFRDDASTEANEDAAAAGAAIILFVIILLLILTLSWSFYSRFGGAWTLSIITIIILLVILFAYWVSVNDTETPDQTADPLNRGANGTGTNNNTDINRNNPAPNGIAGANDRATTGDAPIDRVELPSDDQVIKVVTRADFVDKYVGWTDKKTLKLLNDNLGKVLFIDEAYSLFQDAHDSFGAEALNTLNIYLSQHPGEIIVILAGYQDLMDAGIFEAQPGLKRRCMWHFECNGYTTDQLYEIFLMQLTKKGWGLVDPEATRALFHAHADAFPAFGGDTERLTFFSELEHSSDYIRDDSGMTLNLLSPDHVRRGIATLRKNNRQPTTESANPLANMMKLLRSKKGPDSNDNQPLPTEMLEMINASRNAAGERIYK